MDTLILPQYKKNVFLIPIAGLGLAISIFILSSTVIFAKDLGLGNYTGVSPTLSNIIEEQNLKELNFNESVGNKYAGATISEVEKGIKHIRTIRYYGGRPVRINVVELSTDVNPLIEIEPSIASDILVGRSKISKIAQSEKAIVAINGGFFKPETGVPLGTLMIDQKIYTGPIYDRVALGIFEDGYKMARVKLNASLITNIGGLKIDNVNQPRMLSTHTIVYTRDWGETTPLSPKYGSQLVVDNGKIVKYTKNRATIPQNGYVIVGPSSKLEAFTKAKTFDLKLSLDPAWDGVEHILSGGPYLIKNGEVFVDTTAQKLNSITGRNPRTAIGFTKENHLIMLTADGREGSSVGLTLFELASLMKEYGCVYAMNLDGGGSTVMYIKGTIVNRPAEQGGIPLSHTLVVKPKDLS